MHNILKGTLAALVLGSANVATAQSFSVELEVPRLNVAEYHRPYVALWVAEEDNSVAAQLAVLYDVDMKNQKGEKWLKDLRQWWRRGGRSLDMPIDGISSATRGPGIHTLEFTEQLSDLKPGHYHLMIEASREVGGREMLSIPFQWPIKKDQNTTEEGQKELGKVTLQLTAN